MVPVARSQLGRARPLDREDELVARRVLAHCGLRGADLEDSVQDVLLRVLLFAPPDEKLGPWVARVARNLAMDHHRKEQRRRTLDAKVASRRPGGGDAPDLLTPLVVAGGLHRLRPDHREVIVLRFFAGLSTTQIATRLDIAEGTVKSRLSRALAALRPVLSESQDLRWTA